MPFVMMSQGGLKMLKENVGDDEAGIGCMGGISILVSSLYRRPWVVLICAHMSEVWGGEGRCPEMQG
jgi:hypothetical protein